ncbi:MAG TPA: hypothetical protein VI386_28455 [Candidatus Sulfotelmatobacter sp.]
MSADITGSVGAKFTCTIDAATIVSAYLEVSNQPIVSLDIAANNREVTVPSLPAGQSFVRLDLVWAPGDSNATIDVGTVTAGTATPANPNHTIDDGDTPGYVELFGK